MSAEERQGVVLKAVYHRACMRAGIDLEHVGDPVRVQNVVQFGCAGAQSVWSPTLIAIPRYCFEVPMYWSTKASGAFAAHRAITSCCNYSIFVGKSRYKREFFGCGDQAAADASCARSPKGNAAESLGVFTASNAFSCAAFGVPAPRAARQHGLMMYELPKTSECFIPIRLAP